MLRKFVSCVPPANISRRKSQLTYETQKQTSQNNGVCPSTQSQYTQEESVKILELINTLKLPDYEGYNLSERRASKLFEWMNRNGSLRNLKDIYLVDGFGAKVVERFFQSLLQKPVYNGDKKSSRLRIASLFTPPFDAEQHQQIRSSVSLRIGVSSVSWARLEVPVAELNSPCLLTHWHSLAISGKKLHLQDLVERCLYMDQQIPEADCYLFENPQSAQVNRNPGNAEQQNISIQKSQITAALSFALNRRKFCDTEAKRYNVFYLRRFLTARLFNHFVGTERVSSEETILKLMRAHYNTGEAMDFVHEDGDYENAEASNTSLRGEVLFSSELCQMFANSERYYREFLGQCLLLNLAFVRLAILQDRKSLALINRKYNKDIKNVKTD